MSNATVSMRAPTALKKQSMCCGFVGFCLKRGGHCDVTSTSEYSPRGSTKGECLVTGAPCERVDQVYSFHSRKGDGGAVDRL